MDQRREELQAYLETLLGSGNVYFQPPDDAKMQYPAIIYRRDRGDTEFAGNRPYHVEMRYQVMTISRDPDDIAVRKLLQEPKCVHIRFFAINDLNHDVFTLVF